MIRRLAPLLVGAIACLGLVLAASFAPGAGAQEPAPVTVLVDQVGWWTDRPAASATEEDGFEVATDGEGAPQSVAAAQLTIVATSVESLKITLVESSALAEFGSIAACRTHAAWSPENPGSLSDAPTVDCSTRVELTRAAEGGRWLGEVAPLALDGGTVSLVFVPEYSPPTPIAPGMIVRVAEITAEATGGFAQEDGPSTGGAPTTTSTTTTSAPTGGSASPPPATGTAAPPSGSTTVDVTGSDPLGSNLAASPPPTTAPVSDVATAEDDFFTLGPVERQAAESKPWARLLILLPLSAALGIGSVRLRRLIEARRSIAAPV